MKMKKHKGDITAKVKHLNYLTEYEKDYVLNNASVHQFSKYQEIKSSDDRQSDFHIVISGNVKNYSYCKNGKEVIFEIHSSGDFFGEEHAIRPSSSFSLFSSITECTLATLKHDLFYQLLSSSENFNRQIMYRLAERLQKQMTRIHEYSTLNVKERIRHELYRLAKNSTTQLSEIRVTNPPTHSAIATMVSTHREAVTREIKELEKEGIITWNRKNHIIHDLTRLKSESTQPI